MNSRLDPKMTTALEVAVIVKCLPDLQQAADLIEQYGRTVASAAVCDATAEAYGKVLKSLTREPTNAQA
ncbi:hypothetical protein ACVWZ4_000026 [Bradyrhizobium sp. USDA 4472]